MRRGWQGADAGRGDGPCPLTTRSAIGGLDSEYLDRVRMHQATKGLLPSMETMTVRWRGLTPAYGTARNSSPGEVSEVGYFSARVP